MPLILCCRSSKVEYKSIYIIPDLYFPDFPDPEGKAIPLDKELNKVTTNDVEIKFVLLPLEYYRAVVNYKLDVDKAETKYTTFKEKIQDN